MEKKKSIGCLGIVGIIFAVGFIGSLFDGDNSEVSSTSTQPAAETTDEQVATQTFESFGCLKVSPNLVSGIAGGFDTSELTGRAAGYKSSDYADVKFVAVEFIPNGSSTKEVAVFGTNDDDLNDGSLDGLIIAADGFAKQFSTWGESTNFDLSIADAGAQESRDCLSLPGYKIGGLDAKELGFDQAEFLRIAEEKYGVVDESFEDGSTLRVMDLAQGICNGNISTLKRNLGSEWESSFQKYTLETICPEKLE